MAITDLSHAGYMFSPTEELRFDIARTIQRAERVKALPGWKHPYQLMPGYPLRMR
jgi:glutathione S-transferase